MKKMIQGIAIGWLCLLAISSGNAQEAGYTETLAGTNLEIEMAAIPGGTYTPASRQAGVSPSNVRVDPFWMSSREITWGLYQAFLQRSADSEPQPGRGSEVNLEVDAVSGATIPYVDMSLGMGTGEEFPVGNVTRKAASLFCKWLSAKTGNFYRLPTEAEWEYAARAGTDTPYFFGSRPDSLGRYAWYSGNSDGTYHPVGKKQPNPWGLYDIYGNVAEWTLDRFESGVFGNSASEFEPPVAEYPGVLRGGSYRDGLEALKNSARLASNPVWKQRDPQFPRSKFWFTDAPFAGFRIVRPQNPPEASDFSRYWDTK